MPAKVEILFTSESDKATKEIDKLKNALAGLSEEAQKDFLNIETMEEAEASLKKLGINVEKFKKEQKKATEGSFDFKKQLTGLAKGFIGVSTAYAAGRALVQFSKEALKAAEAAGTLPVEFTRMEKASDDLALAFGTFLGNQGKELLNWIAQVKEGIADEYNAISDLNDLLDKSGINLKEYNEAQRAISLGFIDAETAAASFADRIDVVEEAQRATNHATEVGVELNKRYASIMAESTTITELAERSTWAYKDSIDGLVGGLNLTGEAASLISAQIRQMTRDEVEASAVKTELALATGDLTAAEENQLIKQQENLENIQLLNEQWRTGVVLQEDWIAIMADGLVTQEELATHLADTTKGYETAGSAIAEASENTEILTTSQELLSAAQPLLQKAVEGTAQSFGLWRNRASGAAAQTDRARKAGEDIHGRVYTATFITHNIETFATRGGIGQGKNFKTGLEAGGATGLSGIVPPGFPGDSFTIGATSGESVDIKTKAQQAQGSDFGGLSAMLGGKIDEMGDRIIQALAMNS